MAATTAQVSDRERETLERVRTLGFLLDDAIGIPGTRFRVGLDPILGVLPVSGDLVAALGSLYIVIKGVQLGVPPRTTVKMLALVAADFFVGSIPVLGTFIDAAIKANKRNVELIEEHLYGPAGSPA